MKVAIIDYGAGNAVNVKNALQKIDVSSIVSESASEWYASDAVIFPGVGAFGAAIKTLGSRAQNLNDLITDGRPFLGICLGMQLLMDSSEESASVAGLGVVKGSAKRFSSSLSVPQIGWNQVCVENNCPLFSGLKDPFAYFVHSYYCEPDDRSCIAATTDYGLRFASAFWQKNLFATQFHPEKSGEQGLQILQNFINEVRR